LTAPFAFRAHQSVYARKGDGLFDAAQGVQTPSVSTTNAQLTLNAGTEVALNKDLRVPTARSIYANKLNPNDPATAMNIGNAGTTRITLGQTPQGAYLGTDVSIFGKTTVLAATNLSIVNDLGAQAPMFVRKAITVTANTTSTLTLVDAAVHGIDIYTYEVCVVGWSYSANSPAVRAVYASSGNGNLFIYFNAIPTSGSLTLHLLAYPKAMTGNW
jgi:hypothetical protein